MSLSFFKYDCQESPLVQYINNHRFYVYMKNKDDNRVPNLTMMDGGNLHVPQEKYERFINFVHDYLAETGEHWYLVEKVLPLTRLFFDLDFHTGQDVRTGSQDGTIEGAFEIIVNTISEVFPAVGSWSCVISACMPYIKDGTLKCGYHIIFPEIIVDIEKARAARAAVVFRLDAKMKKFKGIPSWEEAVDASVQHEAKGGLRMLFTGKSMGCQLDRRCRTPQGRRARNREGTKCTQCSNRGHIHLEASPYKPLCELTKTSTGIISKQISKADSRFSIFHFGHPLTTKFKIPGALLASVTERVTEIQRETNKNGTKRKRRQPQGTVAQYVGKNSGKYQMSKELAVTDPVVDKIEKFIRTRRYQQKAHWKDVIVTRVKLFETTCKNLSELPLAHLRHPPWYAIHVNGDGASWCPNKMDHHASNTVWFLFSERGFSVRCFSTKLAVRAGGVYCKKFSTNVVCPANYVEIWDELKKHCWVDTHKTPDEFLPSDDEADTTADNVQKNSQGINFDHLFGKFD